MARKSLLQEIREQPEHIRATFMWVMVVITVALIGSIGFNSVKNNFVAMVDPFNTPASDTAIVEGDTDDTSPFALIGDSFNDLTSQLSSVFSNDQTDEDVPTITNQQEPIEPNRLPIQ